MRRVTVAAGLGVIVCALSVAVGGQRNTTTHTVTIESMRFQPEMLTVAAGDTVVWVNKDLVPHTATSEAGGFDSKTIQAGQSWKHTVRTKGDIAYLCTFHPTMKAMLRVE